VLASPPTHETRFIVPPTHLHLALETVVDLIRCRAAATPDQVAYTILDGDASRSCALTYGALDLNARAIAVTLRAHAGLPVLILLPPGSAYLAAYFGCLYAGAIAVPVDPDDVDHDQVAVEMAEGHGIHAMITARSVRASVRETCADTLDEPLPIYMEEVEEQRASSWRPPEIGTDSLAAIHVPPPHHPVGIRQITHGHLLRNQALILSGIDPVI